MIVIFLFSYLSISLQLSFFYRLFMYHAMCYSMRNFTWRYKLYFINIVLWKNNCIVKFCGKYWPTKYTLFTSFAVQPCYLKDCWKIRLWWIDIKTKDRVIIIQWLINSDTVDYIYYTTEINTRTLCSFNSTYASIHDGSTMDADSERELFAELLTIAKISHSIQWWSRDDAKCFLSLIYIYIYIQGETERDRAYNKMQCIEMRVCVSVSGEYRMSKTSFSFDTTLRFDQTLNTL